MRVPGLHRLRKLFAGHRPSGVAVLCYHRIAEPEVDPWGLCVSPQHFDAHLAALRRWGPVFSLAEVAHALRAGRLPRRAAVVTFDDGYADNLHAALPLLERHGVPATFFVATGMLGGMREFWWDELERLVLRAVLPDPLRLEIGAETHEWATGEPAPTPPMWRAWEAPPSPRHALYYALWAMLIERTEEERTAALAALRTLIPSHAEARPSHRTMTEEEVVTLARSPLVEVGAHTVTHPALPTLEPARQREEVAESKGMLEALLGRSVMAFAYPYGRGGADARAAVAEAGFASACTTEHEPLRAGADSLAVPRFQVLDSDGEALARWLTALLRPS